MSAFQHQQTRFACQGICLNAPADACPPGKYPILENVRSYLDQIVQGRLGVTPLANGGLASGIIHSIARLNDPTPFAAVPFFRVFGAGAKILAGQNAFPQIDTGYSGNPLGLVNAQPVQAPAPWMYVADSSRQRKFDVNGNVVPWGIAPPLTEPSSVLGQLFAEFIFNAGTAPAFVAAGAIAGAVTTIHRINTTITSIFYDSGSSGNASVVPASMDAIDLDCVIVFNGIEAVAVQQVTIAVAATTIAAIIYDAGTSGLCTIQPAASLGTGQLEQPSLNDYQARAGGYAVPPGQEGLPPEPDVTGQLSATIRQVDFPVNCLITLGGAAETVRILSVAIGRDGVQSFRCSTANTHNAADSITGVTAFRVNTAGTYSAGQTLQSDAFHNVLTAPAANPPTVYVGGIQSPGGWTPINNIAQINGVATLPDDDLYLSIRFSDCTVVQSVRVYLDVDASVNTFTQNYRFHEWRSNDILSAIQNVNASSVASLDAARAITIAQNEVNQSVQSLPFGGSITKGGSIAIGAVSEPLALGNNQWLELHCKISDLIAVGTDPSRTLANVAAAEVLVGISPSAVVTVDYGSLFVTGGNNPDVGLTGSPRVYAYRYRSSLTGARSNPSPATRGGVSPRRQSVALTGVQSADPQVDLVDWFTIGGSLTRMTYEGTTANNNPPTFTDIYSDSEINGNPALEYDIFQPWATTDKARTGTCNVAGNALRRVGGTDPFNNAWAPGTGIIINGVLCTLRSQPNGTLAFINENIGSGTGVTFKVPAPTLLGQNLFAAWGPVNGVMFACGDPNNPGQLYWTSPNDPDRTSDANTVVVTSGSDRLQNGFVYDDRPYVFSSEDLFAIIPDGRGGWTTQKTSCGEGLWTPWAFCVAPEGTYFLTKHGIMLTSGGSSAVSITDADLYPIFPHDLTPGIAVNGFNPPDMTQTARLRLASVSEWVYFDYVDTAAASRTLAYRKRDASWWPDVYTPGVAVRCNEDGNSVFEELLGATDGSVYLPSGFNDNNTPFTSTMQMTVDQGDGRKEKLYRDIMLKGVMTSAAVNVALSLTDNTIALGSTAVGGGAGLLDYLINVLPTIGAFGTNLQAKLTWQPTAVGVPALHLWDVAYQGGPELATSWLSGPTTFGMTGFLQVPFALLTYISSAPLTFTVIIDGVLYTYAVPTSGGVYKKFPLWLQAVKGLTFQFGVQSTAPMQLFDVDSEVWVQAWGKGGSYSVTRPF